MKRSDPPSEDPGKRQTILDEAIRTFAEVGFRRADVQVIADCAGVGKGTVYRYFRSKEDLFWATTFDVLEQLDRHIFAAMEGVEGACAKLRAAAIAHAAFFEANPQYLNLIMQERAEFCGSIPESHRAHHEKMLQRMGAVLGQGIESGELRPLDTRQTTLAIGCLLFGTALLSGHVESVNLMKMTGYAIDMFLRGMRNDKGDSPVFAAVKIESVPDDASDETEPSCLTESQRS
ncbi:MAG: TetR/AcrR family transcriptional regulator [Thermoguttaceae bacterium]|jgi:AcrR family transcriptional regulator